MSPTSLLCACSVKELLEGLSSGAVSADEILNSCLGRIRLREAEVKAWAYLDSDNGFAAKKALSRNKKNDGSQHYMVSTHLTMLLLFFTFSN